MAREAAPAVVPPNVLLVVVNELQDADLDRADAAPRLAALANSAMRFRRFVTYPGSSATRAAVLTGRYGRRTGFGGASEPDQTAWELPLDERLLPEVLAQSKAHPWSTAALGSWHLATPRSPHAFDHPNLQGFDHFAGTLADLTTSAQPTAEVPGYLGFEKTVNGQRTWRSRYATTDIGLDAVAQLGSLDAPWLLHVAFQALRNPSVRPPDADSVDDRTAALTAVDDWVGRMLDARPASGGTWVFLLGTAEHAGAQEAALLVAGPGVSPGTCNAAIHAVDVFSTVLELVGVASPDTDGVSFAHLLRDPRAQPGRRFVFTESFAPVGLPPYHPGPYERDDVSIADHQHRLSRTDGRWHWSDLDPVSSPAGPPASRAELRRALQGILVSP